jgi:hypothetical protein
MENITMTSIHQIYGHIYTTFAFVSDGDACVVLDISQGVKMYFTNSSEIKCLIDALNDADEKLDQATLAAIRSAEVSK